MDDDNSRSLSLSEFKKASNDYKLDLDEDEVEVAFIAFDRNNDGSIDYDEFLRRVRGEMNDFRRRFVEQAFDILDIDKNGYIDINDIKQIYNARQHPDVKAGKKSEEAVLNEFIETFEAHHNLIAGEEADHIVTKDEFLEYYENVSISIDDDKYFELMMNNAWKINNAATTKNDIKGWTNKEEEKVNVKEAYKTFDSSNNKNLTGAEKILDKFRKACNSRGGKGIIGLARQFKIFDDDNSKSLEFPEFTKALRDYKLDISQTELKLLFNHFDTDGNGSLNYDEFLRKIRGDMNEKRRGIVMKAFCKLDMDKSGVIDINDIKDVYNAKQHPDVIAGKKTENDILGEFLETFESHLCLKNKSKKDQSITKEEFIEYYNNISSSIDNDEYFELMMNTAWKLKDCQPKPWEENQKKESSLHEGHKIWMNDHYKAQAKGGTVSQYAPFGTTKEPTDYSTATRASIANKNNPHTLLSKLKEKVIARGARGIIGLSRAFQICDDNHSGTIDYSEFTKLLKDYRLIVDEEETRKLFNSFDTDGSAEIDYDEFVRAIVGEMNEFRKGIAKKVFNKLDKNGNGILEVDDLIGVYNAKMHPDVRAGKRSEEEILGDFLDNFERHFSIRVI
jgi:Ca2+-binding EF-hand superfamily protein